MIDNRTRWRSLGAPIAVVALLGLAACGTSSDTGTSTAASASTAAPADDGADDDDSADADPAAYRSCLEANGVSMPEPPAGGGQAGAPPSGAPAAGGPGGPGGALDQAPPGVDDDTWEAAQEACDDLAPTPPDGDASTASPDN
jgi:hypothetical protein